MTQNESVKKTKAFYRSWKFWLVFLLVCSVVAVASWNVIVTQTLIKVFKKYSELRVDEITFDKVSCDPFAQELEITKLVIPQVKVDGVKDELLQGRPVFSCDRLQVAVDLKKYEETGVIHIESLKVDGMELGAVVGPEISRVALMVFPGFLMGEIPDPAGLKFTKFDYHMAHMELKGKLIIDPSKAMYDEAAKSVQEGKLHWDVKPVVVDRLVIKAKNMNNLPMDKTHQMGVLDAYGEIDGEDADGKYIGTIKAELKAKTMSYFDQTGHGYGVLEAKKIPLKESDILVQQLLKGVHFEKGRLFLNWRVGVENAVLKPEKTIFVLDKIFAKTEKSASASLIQKVMLLNIKGMFKKDMSLKGKVADFYIEKFRFRF